MAGYPPVGKCIYCGATSYAPNDSRPLADEHIIPFALGGDRVLLAASCQACETITGTTEQIALRGVLRSTRMALGLRSRKRHPDALPLYVQREKIVYKVEIATPDYPSMLILWAPAWLPPILTDLDIPDTPRAFVTGGPLTKHRDVFFSDQGTSEIVFSEDHPSTYTSDEDGVLSDALDIRRFYRMLAKISHGYAVAEFGLDSFKPYLLEIIRGNADDDLGIYFGGPLVQTTTMVPGIAHQISLHFEHSFEDVWYIVAKIVPFACLGGPTIYSVVGELFMDRLTPQQQAMVRAEPLSRTP
jgi:hypothetical protein